MPDELERLDEELAAGRLDSAGYRRRRDALLAATAGRPQSPEPAGPAGTAAPATEAVAPEVPAAPDPPPASAADPAPVPAEVTPAETVTAGRAQPEVSEPPPVSEPPRTARPVDPPVASDPFPPPFRWDGPPPSSPAPSPPPAWAPLGSSPAVPEEPAERTQFVPGSLARRWSSPVPAATTAPPWGTDRPSRPDGIDPHGSGPADGPVRLGTRSADRMQGAEVFTRSVPLRAVGAAVGTGVVLLLVVVVLLLSFLL